MLGQMKIVPKGEYCGVICVLTQNSYVEALTPNMIVFGSRDFELIRFRWCYESEALTMVLIFL